MSSDKRLFPIRSGTRQWHLLSQSLFDILTVRFLVVKETSLGSLKQKRNSFIGHWAADRLDKKAKVPNLENGSEPKATVKRESWPGLPGDSLVQRQGRQSEPWTLLDVFIKSQCVCSQTPAHEPLGFRESRVSGL